MQRNNEDFYKNVSITPNLVKIEQYWSIYMMT